MRVARPPASMMAECKPPHTRLRKVTGDIQSGLLAVNDIKNGDYKSAVLNGLGLLPFMPSFGGIIKEMPSPSWRKSSPSLKVGRNPAKEEMELLQNKEKNSANGSGYGDLRALMPTGGGSHYFWPASDALHSDVGNYFKLNPQDYKHGILEGD